MYMLVFYILINGVHHPVADFPTYPFPDQRSCEETMERVADSYLNILLRQGHQPVAVCQPINPITK